MPSHAADCELDGALLAVLSRPKLKSFTWEV